MYLFAQEICTLSQSGDFLNIAVTWIGFLTAANGCVERFSFSYDVSLRAHLKALCIEKQVQAFWLSRTLWQFLTVMKNIFSLFFFFHESASENNFKHWLAICGDGKEWYKGLFQLWKNFRHKLIHPHCEQFSRWRHLEIKGTKFFFFFWQTYLLETVEQWNLKHLSQLIYLFFKR